MTIKTKNIQRHLAVPCFRYGSTSSDQLLESLSSSGQDALLNKERPKWAIDCAVDAHGGSHTWAPVIPWRVLPFGLQVSRHVVSFSFTQAVGEIIRPNHLVPAFLFAPGDFPGIYQTGSIFFLGSSWMFVSFDFRLNCRWMQWSNGDRHDPMSSWASRGTILDGHQKGWLLIGIRVFVLNHYSINYWSSTTKQPDWEIHDSNICLGTWIWYTL